MLGSRNSFRTENATLWQHAVVCGGAWPPQVTEQALRAALAPSGFVWSLTLPRQPDGRLKGFAFAAFTLRSHADKAVSQLNGMVRAWGAAAGGEKTLEMATGWRCTEARVETDFWCGGTWLRGAGGGRAPRGD